VSAANLTALSSIKGADAKDEGRNRGYQRNPA
jgi:hypothetical protein